MTVHSVQNDQHADTAAAVNDALKNAAKRSVMREIPHGPFTAIILAGARKDDCPVASTFGEKYKALVPLAGRPMISYALDALRASKSVGDIIIVFDGEDALYGASDSLTKELDDANVQVVSTASSICKSIIKTIEETGKAWPYLVTTADHALLTPNVVDHYCDEVAGIEGMSAAFVSKKHIEAMHPNSKRTYLPFKDAKLSGANLFAFTNDESLKVLDFWQSVENERKRPWKLFKAFGFINLVCLMLRQFTVKRAFERASKVLGVKTVAVQLPYAEAAIDVDTPTDYMQVTKILEQRNSAS